MKKKFMVFARVVFLFITALIIAVVVALSQIDMNKLRDTIVGVLRDSTNLPIEISGDISWRLSLRPNVTLQNITVPNKPNAKHKNIIEVDTIDVRFDLISLFRDRPTIQRVRANDIKVYLDKDSKGNFVLPVPKDEKKPSDTSDAETAETISEYPFVDPGLGGLDINKLDVYIDGERYSLGRMNFRYVNFSKNQEYRGWFKLGENVIPFIISFSKYDEEHSVYPARFAFSSNGDALVVNVSLDKETKMPTDFTITGDIPDVQPVGNLLNLKFPKMPAVHISIDGRLDENKLTLRKSSMNVRNSDIDFSGFINWGKKNPGMKLNISAKKINLLELFPEIYGGSSAPKNRELNVFKDMPLGGKYLYNRNIELNVDLGQLIVYRNLHLDKLKLNARVRGSDLRVSTSTKFADGNVVAAISGIIESNGKLDLEMGGYGQNVVIGKILEQIHTDDFISGLPIDFAVYLQAYGSDMSEIMSTVTGPIRLYSTEAGYAHSELVAYMYGQDFLTNLRHSIQDMFTEDKKYDQMTIKKLAINLKLRDGLAETHNGIAIETNAINIMLDGHIDLGAEELQLALTTIPVRGIKLSLSGNLVNTMVVTGNLAEPDISISGAAVAGKAISATGLGLLLAPFTGGIGFVAGAGVGLLAGDLLENWLADEHPCETALDQGAPVRRGDPEWLAVPAKDLADAVINMGRE